MMPTMIRTPGQRIVRLFEGATFSDRIEAVYDFYREAEYALEHVIGLGQLWSNPVFRRLDRVRDRWLDAVSLDHNQREKYKAQRCECAALPCTCVWAEDELSLKGPRP